MTSRAPRPPATDREVIATLAGARIYKELGDILLLKGLPDGWVDNLLTEAERDVYTHMSGVDFGRAFWWGVRHIDKTGT